MLKGLVGIVVTWVAVGSGASTMYVSSSLLSQVDLVQKKHVLIGDPGLGNIPELASDWREDSFRLWTTRHSGSGSTLYQLNAATGQILVSTPLIFPTDPVVQTLAFDPKTNRMFGTGGGSAHPLYQIDPLTGAVTLVANFGNQVEIYGTAFDLAGNLWATGSDLTLFPGAPSADRYVLFKLDPATATVISEVKLAANSQGPTDIAFRPDDGQLFGSCNAVSADQSLMSIDPVTGTFTRIPMTNTQGSSGGIAFGPVPEPTGVLWVLGGVLIVKRRSRARRAVPGG